MRRWPTAAPRERTTIADSAAICASGAADGISSGWLIGLLSRRGGSGTPAPLPDDLGADGADRPAPQAGPLHQGPQRRVGPDLLEGPRGGDPQAVPGRRGEPEAAHQDRAQPRHRLVAAERPT